MNRRLSSHDTTTDLIQVVLDDAAVERLRDAAAVRGMEVEQLMVQLLRIVSGRVDEVLADAEPGGSGSGEPVATQP